jgi:KaiC/GvpD/RAD55 family RecA-like ATPase
MMQKFGWNISEYEKKKRIQFIDIFQRGLQAITAKTKEGRAWEGIIQPDKVAEASFNLQTIITAGQAFALNAIGKDLFVVFDSLAPLFFGYDDYRKVVRLLQHMKFGSRISGAIGISTLVRGAHPENVENACQMLADGVIELRRIERAGHIERYLRIKKMHKTTFSEDYYPMEITNSGIVVHNVPTSSFIPIP